MDIAETGLPCELARLSDLVLVEDIKDGLLVPEVDP